MSLTMLPQKSGFYFMFDRVWILADDPEASVRMKECPQVPVASKEALDLICELTQSKATAEAKIMLLKKAIEAL